MAKSLQEQLLAAGAVDKNRATRLKKAKHKQVRQRTRGGVLPDEIKVSAQQTHEKKVAHDRELSRLKQKDTDAKALISQVRQLVELNRVEKGDGDDAYSFSDKNVVKTIYVEQGQKQRLADGALAIARVDDVYELIPTPVALKIMERYPDAIIVLNDGDEQSDASEEYAAYKVPDDLDW